MKDCAGEWMYLTSAVATSKALATLYLVELIGSLLTIKARLATILSLEYLTQTSLVIWVVCHKLF